MDNTYIINEYICIYIYIHVYIYLEATNMTPNILLMGWGRTPNKSLEDLKPWKHFQVHAVATAASETIEFSPTSLMRQVGVRVLGFRGLGISVVSLKMRGPQYRPPNIIFLAIRTPKI